MCPVTCTWTTAKKTEKYGKDEQHTLLPDRAFLWW
jgi:hypothetical protein